MSISERLIKKPSLKKENKVDLRRRKLLIQLGLGTSLIVFGAISDGKQQKESEHIRAEFERSSGEIRARMEAIMNSQPEYQPNTQNKNLSEKRRESPGRGNLFDLGLLICGISTLIFASDNIFKKNISLPDQESPETSKLASQLAKPIFKSDHPSVSVSNR
jgi:hypothetical protein